MAKNTNIQVVNNLIDDFRGYVSGFLFLRKIIASTASTAVNALFFSLPDADNYQCLLLLPNNR